MERREIFELRAGKKLWATMAFEPDGRVELEHNLTEDQVKLCPGLVLYDESGQMVKIQHGEIGNDRAGVRLYWPDGRIRRKLALAIEIPSDIDDVTDPKGQVRLGLGGAGGGRVFNLRWIAEPA